MCWPTAIAGSSEGHRWDTVLQPHRSLDFPCVLGAEGCVTPVVLWLLWLVPSLRGLVSEERLSPPCPAQA
jgi:hypothetical protein